MPKKFDKKGYKYFAYCPGQNKIVAGNEFKEDAQDFANEIGNGQLKVYTRVYLKKLKVDPANNDSWGTDRNLTGIKSNLINLVRKEVMNQLKKVNSNNAPKLFELLKSKKGYTAAESQIIEMMIKDKITPSAAVPQIEMEM